MELFPGHVVSSRSMARKQKMHRMLIWSLSNLFINHSCFDKGPKNWNVKVYATVSIDFIGSIRIWLALLDLGSRRFSKEKALIPMLELFSSITLNIFSCNQAITNNNFQLCGVRFCAYVRQSFQKQLYTYLRIAHYVNCSRYICDICRGAPSTIEHSSIIQQVKWIHQDHCTKCPFILFFLASE